MVNEQESSNSELNAGVKSQIDETRIDLGEDLLEVQPITSLPLELADSSSPPVPSSLGPKTKKPFNLSQIPDALESAKILFNEGFGEDAKKILHRVLILDPSHASARQCLSEVHELELKQIFGEGSARRHYGQGVDASLAEADSEEIFRKLDQDLSLGMSKSFSLFDHPDLLESFCRKLERDLIRAGAMPRDWIDLGIAFFEMDLYSISERLFLGAGRKLDSEVYADQQTLLSATCLLALSLILSGRLFDAVSRLQPMLLDVDLKHEDKIELFYLMGRTYEAMKRMDLAHYYFHQVIGIDPHYRDIDRRLKAV